MPENLQHFYVMQDVWSTLDTLKEKDPEKYKVWELRIFSYCTVFFEKQQKILVLKKTWIIFQETTNYNTRRIFSKLL